MMWTTKQPLRWGGGLKEREGPFLLQKEGLIREWAYLRGGLDRGSTVIN